MTSPRQIFPFRATQKAVH